MSGKWISILALGAFLPFLVSAPSRAQRGAAPTTRGNPRPNGPTGSSEHVGTGEVRYKSRTIVGELIEVRGPLNFISMRVKSGQVMEFSLDTKTRLKADKKTDLANKKDIELGDFQTGQTVEVTFGLDDQRVHEVRLKRPKKS